MYNQSSKESIRIYTVWKPIAFDRKEKTPEGPCESLVLPSERRANPDLKMWPQDFDLPQRATKEAIWVRQGIDISNGLPK